MMVVELDNILRGGRTSISCTGDEQTTQCVNDETLMRQCGTQGGEMKQLIGGCSPNENNQRTLQAEQP